VLVVDDEASVVDVVATALRYEGYDVADASNGEQTLSAIRSLEPDLVILDWTLPDIDGIEISRLLRDQGDRTAIVFLTAKVSLENKIGALNAGADDYITKPFSLDELVARVESVLRRSSAGKLRATDGRDAFRVRPGCSA
jgi:two-component system, OmpR family, response regulator